MLQFGLIFMCIFLLRCLSYMSEYDFCNTRYSTACNRTEIRYNVNKTAAAGLRSLAAVHSSIKVSKRKHTSCLTSYLDAVSVGRIHDSRNQVLSGLPVVVRHPGRIPGQHQHPYNTNNTLEEKVDLDVVLQCNLVSVNNSKLLKRSAWELRLVGFDPG